MNEPHPPDFNQVKDTRYGPMVYNVHDTFVGRSLHLYGEYGEKEVEILRQFLTPGDVVIDAGANIGALTVPLAKAIGPTGCIIAYEAQRVVFQALCANMALNQITHAVCKNEAVGARSGTITVPYPNYHIEQNFGGVSIEDFEEGEGVPLVTIDSLGLARCRLMKFDVEGMEQQAVEGAAETIRRTRPILYVENDRFDRSDDLVRTIVGLGYRLYWHKTPLFNPDNFSRYTDNVFSDIRSCNMLGIPDEASVKMNGFEPVATP